MSLDLASPLVKKILEVISKHVYELKESPHLYYFRTENSFLCLLEKMVSISSKGRCTFRWAGFDFSEKKILLLMYANYLGAGRMLSQFGTRSLKDAPIFDSASREATDAFFAVWENNEIVEWHMPSVDLWFDLLFVQRTVARLWPLVIEVLALQQAGVDCGEYQYIDQRISNALHCHILMTILLMELEWNGNIASNSKIVSQIMVTNKNKRFRRLLITLGLECVSGWILISSALKNKHASLHFPPTLRELEDRQSRVLFIQRVGPVKSLNTIQPSSLDNSLPPIDIDMMCEECQHLGLDVWFVGDVVGSEHIHA